MSQCERKSLFSDMGQCVLESGHQLPHEFDLTGRLRPVAIPAPRQKWTHKAVVALVTTAYELGRRGYGLSRFRYWVRAAIPSGPPKEGT